MAGSGDDALLVYLADGDLPSGLLPAIPDGARPGLRVLWLSPASPLARSLKSVAFADGAAEPGPRDWQVSADGRSLKDPEGRELALTGMERAVVACLFEHRGESVSRELLSESCAGNPEASDPQRINVVISRLRTKARRLGFRLPLLSVRGQGYQFGWN